MACTVYSDLSLTILRTVRIFEILRKHRFRGFYPNVIQISGKAAKGHTEFISW